ncbi:hypothetical protein IJF91_01960 [Candidatus Saccharibacteria bacterium]|nr:hypothetical protein [Candidatus Saccharibacteria bacterium]
MSGGKNFYSKLQRWADEFKMSLYGAILAFSEKRFLTAFIIAFIFFGTLLNMLVGGAAGFALFSSANLGGKLEILRDAFLGTFGVGREFIDWLFIFFMTILQATLIGLVVFVFKYRKDSANLQNAGIITGLIILGSGCPTCGTSVLAPIIISIAGSSGMAVVGTVSWVLTVLSIVVAFFALKKVGFETYAILMEERYNSKKKGKNESRRDS